MAIICYNGKFVTTAKSLETNVAVVTRVDCTRYETNYECYAHIMWKGFVCSLMFNYEHDLVYFRLNYVAGRGLCIACNTLRMLVLDRRVGKKTKTNSNYVPA
jgi:hypothetical protein